MLIASPLTIASATVLRAYAMGAPLSTPRDPTRPQEWASTTDNLVGAGFLSRSPRGILVTPEGLAAVLDAVPVEVMRTASPTAELSAGPPGMLPLARVEPRVGWCGTVRAASPKTLC